MIDRIIIDENGIPRLPGRRIPISLIVAQIGSSSYSVESFAEEFNVNKSDVRAALRWAAIHPEYIDTVYRRRADALREEVVDYPGDVDPPDGEPDPAEYLSRVHNALRVVQREWRPYSESRWGRMGR